MTKCERMQNQGLPGEVSSIKDIARIAGVSHSTVSRCLNGSPLVSEKTRMRILEITNKIGFELNANARALVSRKTNTIGILYASSYDNPMNAQYTKLLMHDLQDNLGRLGYDAIPSPMTSPATGDSSVFRLVRQRKVDGILTITTPPTEEEFRQLRDSGIPVAVVDPEKEDVPCDTFGVDNVRGGAEATACLLDRGGCTNVITLSLESPNIAERTQGFLATLKARGYQSDGRVFSRRPGNVFDIGYRFARDTADFIRSNGIDGVFAQADLLALGIIRGLSEAGVRVPDDVRVVGYDDAIIGTYFPPALTTMHQPREQLSYSAAIRIRSLIEDSADTQFTHVRIPPVLVMRESC